jgi:GR25 family glycosyltransferase involved in LPS biosynthesis
MEHNSLKLFNNRSNPYYIDFFFDTSSNHYNIIHNNKTYNIIESFKNNTILFSLFLKPNHTFIINNNHNKIKIKNIRKIEIKRDKQIKINKIYIINLEYRTDRKIKLTNILQKYNINNYEFIDAIDKNNEFVKQEYQNLKLNNKTNIKTIGHFACLLSHLKVINMINENDKEYNIILEDDVFFDVNFVEKLENIKFSYFDMMYIGGLIDDYKIIFDDYCYHNRIMGMYAYIINPINKNKILKILNKKKYPCDIAIIKKIQQNELYKNKIIYIDLIKTEIQTTDTGKKSTQFIDMFNKNINIIE